MVHNESMNNKSHRKAFLEHMIIVFVISAKTLREDGPFGFQYPAFFSCNTVEKVECNKSDGYDCLRFFQLSLEEKLLWSCRVTP